MSGIQALLVENEYADLEMLSVYDVDRVFSVATIQLKGNKRRYQSKCFVLMKDGKRLTHSEAYKIYCLHMAKNK